MSNPFLSEIKSIINGYSNALDRDRVFTYIEFVKQFGYDNDTNIFIVQYKDYVSKWHAIKKGSITLSDEEFVMKKMIDVLKSITLDYSSYEEQDFIAHVDLSNKDHLKALSSLYSRKIREITEFYRKKRNESSLIVKRHQMKGSTKSIQEIIYEKVFDFIFSNRNIVPSFKNIKRDLLISIEKYVDTYSEYFDIPRQKEFTDETRAEMLSANMNDVDYRVYIEIELVVSEILFSGDVYLEEIPLIAQIAADLSVECVGNMLMLKNQLMANTTVNLVDLDEQVALKRKLYEKFLGCDLWYMYVDLQGNVKIDILCKAKSPSGNLLNVGNADTATIPNENLELLSHIGLFFKPDKTSILKINAKDYSWTIDRDVIQNDTVYVFPDPNRQGDIGNNKNVSYPLMMEYKLDYDVKNFSSGQAKDDPMLYITDQGWYSYYSKQNDDFKIQDNKKFEYAFTYLANRGYVSNYQTDAWGNQFGLLKGCKIEYNYDSDNNPISVKSITLNPKYNETVMKNSNRGIVTEGPIILNGGYFEHPLYEGLPFDYSKQLTLIDRDDEKYMWSGISTFNNGFYLPSDSNFISFGEFGCHEGIIYKDHFQKTFEKYEDLIDEDIVIDNILKLLTLNELEYGDVKVIQDEKSFIEEKKEDGQLFIKLNDSYDTKPIDFSSAFSWVNLGDDKIINFSVAKRTLILETDKRYVFIPYSYEGNGIINSLGHKEMLELYKNDFLHSKILFNESDGYFYIIQIEKLVIDKEDKNNDGIIEETTNPRTYLIPRIYRFDCENYKITQVVDFYESVCEERYISEKIDKISLFSEYIKRKNEIKDLYKNQFQLLLKYIDDSEHYFNLGNMEIPYYVSDILIKDIVFSYNNNLNRYLLSFVLLDNNETPYLHEHKFKVDDLITFNDTLVSNIYTLKSDGDSYKWNNVLDNTKWNVIPYNNKSKNVNAIWKKYNGKGLSNNGFYDSEIGGGSSNFDKDFSGESFDSESMPGSNSWISMVYEIDEYGRELNRKRKVIGTLVFNSGSKISNQGDNEFNITLKNLKLLDKNLVNYITIKNISGTFNVNCDCGGVYSGHFDRDFTIDTTDVKRSMSGNASVFVSGDMTGSEVRVIITIWDYYNNSISDDPITPNKPIIPGDDEPDGPIRHNYAWGTVNMYSDVYLYDNIDGLTHATFDKNKKIDFDDNDIVVMINNVRCKFKYDDDDEIPQYKPNYKNDIDISWNKFSVYDIENGKATKTETEIYQKDQLDTIDLYLTIDKNQQSTVGNRIGNVYYYNNNYDKLNDGIYTINGTGSLISAKSSFKVNRGDVNQKEYIAQIPSANIYLKSNWDRAKQKPIIDIYANIAYRACNYNSYIEYDSACIANSFNVEKITNASYLFVGSGDSPSWSFCDDSKSDRHVSMKNCLTFTSSFAAHFNSRCRIENSQCTKINRMFASNEYIADFSIKGDSGGEPLAKVENAAAAFCLTRCSLDIAKFLSKNQYATDDSYKTKYSKDGKTDPRYFSRWYQYVYNFDKLMRDCTDTGKAFIDKFYKYIKEEKIKINNSFDYNMKSLLAAELMFNDNNVFRRNVSTLGSSSKYKYDATLNRSVWVDDGDVVYKYCTKYYNTNLVTPNQEIILEYDRDETSDFKDIKLKCGKLICGAAMFFNRCLRVSEAKIFADSLPNNFKNGVFDKVYNYIKGKADISTLKVNGRCYCYPTITIFFDLVNNFNQTDAENVLKSIADKGWEVASNIACGYSASVKGRKHINCGKNYEVSNTENTNFVCRASEYGALSGLVQYVNKKDRNTITKRNDYHFELCKSVLNAFVFDNRDEWVRFCKLWKAESTTGSTNEARKKDQLSQVLGEPCSNFKDTNDNNDLYSNGYYCKCSWWGTTPKKFVNKYNLESL